MATFKFGGIKHDITNTATAGGTTTLTNASTQVQRFTGSSNQNVVFPDATTLSTGYWFIISNDSTGTITVKDGSSTTLNSLSAGQFAEYYLAANGTAAGTWDVQAGSGTVDLTTGVTGVLPLANGGTNKNATANAGAVVYSDADSFELSAVGSSGQIFQSAGTSAPGWTTATYPATTTANRILYSSANNTVGQITSANTAALVTDSSGVPAYTSGTTANRVLRTDGTTISFSQVSLTTDATGVLPLANGGTNKNITASAGAVAYTDSDSFELTSVGTSGQALISGGTGAPTWYAPTAGSILFAGTGGILQQDNSNLFWDDSNNRIGLLTATPLTNFDLNQGNMSIRHVQNSTNGAIDDLPSDSSAVVLIGTGVQINGIANASAGRMLYIRNDTGANVTIKNLSSSPILSNRIYTGTGADYVLPPKAAVLAHFEIFEQRWQLLNAPNAGGFASPLTTKGDIHTYSTTDARLPVGSNNQLLFADSSTSTGLNWTTATYPITTTANRILYSSANNTVSQITSANTAALVTDSSGVPSFTSGTTANRVLRTDGTSITFSQVALATDVSGTLPVANGGTGQTTLTNHGVLVGAGTSGITQLAAAAAGTLLAGQGTGSDPAFTATPTLGVAGTTSGTLSMAGSTSGTITIQTQAAAGTYNFNLPTSAGTSGQPLLSGGGSGTAMTFGTLSVGAGGTGQTSYTDGQLLIGNSTGNTLTKATLTAGSGISITNGSGSITIAATGGGGSAGETMFFADEKSSGTEGGSASSGANNVRTLNTTYNPGSYTWGSLSSNQVSLNAGTYIIEGSAPAFAVNGHIAKFYNATDSTNVIIGSSEYSANSDSTPTRSTFWAMFTIASTKAYEVRHYIQTTKSTNGFGVGSSSGDNNVFTQLKVTKIA